MIPRKHEGTGERYSPEIEREIARSRTWPTGGKDIVPLQGSIFYRRAAVRLRKFRVKIVEVTGGVDIFLPIEEV